MRGSDNLSVEYDDSINRTALEHVYGKTNNVDFGLPPLRRMQTFLPNVESTSSYMMEGYQIDLIWNEKQRTLQESLANILAKE